jgi:hypothetical protein
MIAFQSLEEAIAKHVHSGDVLAPEGFTYFIPFAAAHETNELLVTSLHPGVTREQIAAATGWPVRFAIAVAETPPPDTQELSVRRNLQARMAQACGAPPDGGTP